MSHRSLMLRRAVAATLALSGIIAAPVTYAQTPPAEGGDTLGAIIVTAQKREQNLQDVPVVVTAISEELLHDTGIKDIKDLTLLTPGLLVTSSSSEASTTARIRGVGTVGDNPGLESSVGVVIDGVYRPRNGVSFGDLGDMERIEVLKGPQGTLFGKNTSAGVINVITKKPSFEPSAVFEVTGGNRGAFEVSSSINGGIVDEVAAGRLFAAIRKRDGLIAVQTAGGPREDRDANRDFYTVRGQLLFNLGDNADLRLVGDVTERDEECCAAVQMVYGSQGVRALVDAVAPDEGVIPVVNPDLRLAYANRSYGQETKDKGLSAELNADIGDISLTSVTAYRKWLSIRGQDTDFTTADIWYRNANGNVYSKFTQVTEELRLAGEAGRLNWLAGVFYTREKLNTGDELLYGAAFEPYVSLTSTGGASATTLAAWAALPFGTLYPAGQGLKDAYQQTAESYAVFTNNSIEITDGLELTLGARFTSEDKELTSWHWNPGAAGSTACGRLLLNVAGLLPGAPAIPGAAQPAALGFGCGTWADPAFNNAVLTQSLDESKVTGTAKIAYRFADPVMAYLSYARGYKASGFNLDRERITFGTIDPDKSFPEETVDSFELGVKNTLGGGAVLLNAAAFHQVFDNFQLNTFLGTSFVVTAVKEVTSYGIDADLIYQTDFGLGIQSGVTWSKTEITDFGSASSVVRSDRLNDRLGFAPLWSASGAISYEVPMGDYSFGTNLSAKYNSSYNTGSNLDPRKLQDSYTLVNARVGFGREDEAWTIELWGTNITDENYAQVMFDAPLQGSSTSSPASSTIDAFLGQRRLFGASLILKF